MILPALEDASSAYLIPQVRPRSKTVTELHEWRRGRVGSGVFSDEDVDQVGPEGWSRTRSSPSSSSEGGSDSAYGTLDEREDEERGLFDLRRKGSLKLRTARRRGRRSRSAGDNAHFYERTSASSSRETLFGVDFDYSHENSSFAESSSPATTLSVASSQSSSPTPSECDFDGSSIMIAEGGLTSPKSTSSPQLHRVRTRPSWDDVSSAKLRLPSDLSRRHTVPRRRRRTRAPSSSISISFITTSLATELSSSSTLDDRESGQVSSFLQRVIYAYQSRSIPPITRSATFLSVLLSSVSPFTTLPLLPASPVHLLRPRGNTILEVTNAALSPFFTAPSLNAVALSLANLASLKVWEQETKELYRGTRGQVLLLSSLWSAIMGIRVLLSYIFGRSLGWAYPALFSTAAIHEVGAGLLPLLLAVSILRVATQPKHIHPSSYQMALLAANFSTPIEQGGTGRWYGISGIIVGLLSSFLYFAYIMIINLSEESLTMTTLTPSKAVDFPEEQEEFASAHSFPIFSSSSSSSSPSSSPSSPSSLLRTIIALFSLLLLPLFATEATFFPGAAGLKPTESDLLASTFANLHPSHPQLLTVLLMSAPRPGNPDFLIKTLESWLSTLPDLQSTTPVIAGSPRSRFGLMQQATQQRLSHSNHQLVAASPLDISDRIRLIVYTHFKDHQVFDEAQRFFSASSLFKAKAEKYIEWRRDPRATANRLDQRLHVARGLEYASKVGIEGGESAYVMLTEDDFPLCEDDSGEGGWKNTWKEFMRVMVAMNVAMPDHVPSSSSSSSSSKPWSLSSPSSSGSIWDKVMARSDVVVPAPPAILSSGDDSSMVQEALNSGHCGLFIATGGSGLAIRGFIAAQLPAMLLGEDDPQGDDRDARASRGEFSVKREDEGADTPDLVIQDCLRGRLPGLCQVCAPPSSSPLSLFLSSISPSSASSSSLSSSFLSSFSSSSSPSSSPSTSSSSLLSMPILSRWKDKNVRNHEEKQDSERMMMIKSFPPRSARNPQGVLGDRWGKSGLVGTERLMQRHLGYNASTLPGRKYGREEWACRWRQPFNGEPDVLTV